MGSLIEKLKKGTEVFGFNKKTTPLSPDEIKTRTQKEQFSEDLSEYNREKRDYPNAKYGLKSDKFDKESKIIRDANKRSNFINNESGNTEKEKKMYKKQNNDNADKQLKEL